MRCETTVIRMLTGRRFPKRTPRSARARDRVAYRPDVAQLEERRLLSGLLATGARPGSPPEVRLYDVATGQTVGEFLAGQAGYRGGVEVAVGDVNDDGEPEIVTATDPGGRPTIQVFDQAGTLLDHFLANQDDRLGGLSLAVGDVNGDGRDDVVVFNPRGSSRISIYDALSGTSLGSFFAYGPRYRGGVQVALGDINRDGHADIIVTNESGRPEVKIFDGATLQVIRDFQPIKQRAAGQVAIASGDINGDHTPDIIVATPGRVGKSAAANVQIFNGATNSLLAAFQVPGQGYSSGVHIAAIDINGDHTDDLALAPVGRGSGVVLDTSMLRDEASTAFDYSETGTMPLLQDAASSTPPIAYNLAGSVGSLAASASVTESTPAALAAAALTDINVTPLTPIQRLAYFDPSTGIFVPVSPNDPRLAGKDVTVLVHGWAPGYINWVKAAAKKGYVLTWWDTFPGQPGYDKSISGGKAPNSQWLLDGTSASGIQIAQTGMAQMIDATDPNAAVLAYTWLDDSATPQSSWTGIPEDAYLSEARTALNGERLADGLEQVLGSNFDGKLQLMGHSHGSKVATVAAVALSQAPTPIHVNQLTTLDSPESPDTSVGLGIAEDGAGNYNWYFLQALNINRQSSAGTFVDNVISYFDTPYDVISYIGSNENLGQVVDTTLYPEPYSAIDVGDQHSYAAYWYTGSGEPGLTYGNSVGREWSPLLTGNSGPNAPPANLIPSYQQSWTFYNYSQSNQFDLEPYAPSAANPEFNAVTLPAQNTPGVVVSNTPNGATVDLTQTGGNSQTYSGTFTTSGYLHGIRGITFQYEFPKSAAGDELTISIDGDLGFVMDPSVLLSPTGLGTISVGDVFGDANHTLTFTLTSSAPNPTSEVKISQVQQYSWA